MAQGYKDVKERSAIARFKVKDEDAYILAWTTTPWTLPSNVALCVNPEEQYVKVKAADGYTYYMAEAFWIRFLVLWKEKKEHRRTKFWKLMWEKIWNIKNTNHYIISRSWIRKRITLSAIPM